MHVTVRPLAPADRAQWEPLWKGYQAFYQVVIPPETTDMTWARFHDPAEPMHALGAFDGERLVGIVHTVFHRSTWLPTVTCYLQDLFVLPDQRGRSIGRALIEGVYAAADHAGAGRVYWLTHETNVDGRRLYDKVALNRGFIQYARRN
jgi:GNAT superfamily N-acetyltransferase